MRSHPSQIVGLGETLRQIAIVVLQINVMLDVVGLVFQQSLHIIHCASRKRLRQGMPRRQQSASLARAVILIKIS